MEADPFPATTKPEQRGPLWTSLVAKYVTPVPIDAMLEKLDDWYLEAEGKVQLDATYLMRASLIELMCEIVEKVLIPICSLAYVLDADHVKNMPSEYHRYRQNLLVCVKGLIGLFGEFTNNTYVEMSQHQITKIAPPTFVNSIVPLETEIRTTAPINAEAESRAVMAITRRRNRAAKADLTAFWRDVQRSLKLMQESFVSESHSSTMMM